MAEGDSQSQGTSQSSSGGTQQTQSGGAASGDVSQPSTTQSQQTAPSRPDWCPENCFDPQKGFNAEAYGKHYAESVAPQLTAWAAEQVRRNALPTNAADYKADLPKDFQPPEGFKINEQDPALGKARDWAKKHGISQDAFSEMLAIDGARQIATQQTLKTAYDAEIAKLGANGGNRIDAIGTFLTGTLGEDAKHLIGEKGKGGVLWTAGIVQAFEKLIGKVTTQGAASFSGQHREPGEPGRVSDDQWARMSPAQRLDYNRRFDQGRMPEWRDPRAA